MKQAVMGVAATGLAVALTGCATSGGNATPYQTVATSTLDETVCNAAPAQYHISHDATQAIGEAILKDSGARTLRWGPPQSAWTMDYRQDRVNVRYDDTLKITEITCG